jgi:phage-related protein
VTIQEIVVDVIVLDQCKKEIDDFPFEVKEDLFDTLRDLREGMQLTMPVSKRMLGMGPCVYELRFKDRSGIYRVIYLMKKNDAMYLVHGFKKKSNKTPIKNIETAIRRIKKI